jgi:hypothetical protein
VEAAGWLERLSGPGPFIGVQYVFPLWCHGWKARSQPAGETREAAAVESAAATPTIFQSWDCMAADPSRRRAIVGVDFAYLWTKENPLTYAGPAAQNKPGVNALLVVPYVSAPLGHAFEAGAGAGFLRLTDRDGSVNFSSTKFVLQPIRLTFKPVSLFADDPRWESIQFGLNAMVIVGKLDAETFGAVPPSAADPTAQPFREVTELLWQAQIRFDVVRFVKGTSQSRRQRDTP